MNPDNATLIARQYPEIVDDVLTAIVGGVVNEPILFDLKIDTYPLSQKAGDVRSIIGTRNRAHTAFKPGIDFVFAAAQNAVTWQKGGAHPDDETTFYVDYFPPDSASPLTDINVGSVTRTLGEAISREIAVVYQQIQLAYNSGFVDTATGQALDLVVAILGVVRKTGDFATGLVTFFRDPAVGGTITVAQGTELRTTDAKATFETTDVRTLQQGQLRIDVPVRATDASRGEVGKVAAGTITALAQPIAGIDHVTNVEATVLGAADETDAQLRARAKATLSGLGKATLLALARVIFDDNADLSEVLDPNGPPDKRSDPGTVTLLVDTEPARFASLQAAVDQTRAAGVLATLVARYVFVKPRMVAHLGGTVAAAGKSKLAGQIIAAAQSYVDTLHAGDPADGQALIKAVTDQVKELSGPTKLRIVDLRVERADIQKPGPEALVDSLLAALAGAPPNDAAALRTAITGVLDNAPSTLPTSQRIADRSLLQGPGGQPPTDDQIEAGQFKVLTAGPASLGGQKWRVALDMQPADVILVES